MVEETCDSVVRMARIPRGLRRGSAAKSAASGRSTARMVMAEKRVSDGRSSTRAAWTRVGRARVRTASRRKEDFLP